MGYLTAVVMVALAAVTSAKATEYRVETIASGLDHPWSMAFLPDGGILVTERPGRLRLVGLDPAKRPKLLPESVVGVPPVLARGQAGLFDVVLDPAFEMNKRLLLSFAHGTLEENHLRVVSARLEGRELNDVKPIFTSAPAKSDTQHFGGRMAWLADGSIIIGMGDGNLDRTDAQRLHTHLGKLLRFRPDGSIPADNPFIKQSDVRPEIYSYGHRNPQGMLVVNGVVFAHEHGARGGDELNRITPGANYGWPLTTGGIDYTFARITPYQALPGTQSPLVEWTPSIAPAGFAWYDAPLFPEWRGSFLVAALKERSVRRVPMVGDTPGTQEVLFEELGERIRDVRTGPEGAVYLLTDSANGSLLRVTPTTP